MSADLDSAVLALIAAHVGKVLPPMRDIADTLGTSAARISHAFDRLVQSGAIATEGRGNERFVRIIGGGSTLPRYIGKEVATYQAREFEPIRLESFSCPRCGARNCLRHTASFISSGRLGGWQSFVKA